MMMELQTLVSFLDQELNVAAFEDASHNGLQVERAGGIRRICAGVDASMAFFERAAEQGADLLICHHGLSWGDSLKRITGLNYRRLKFLMDHNIGLYACHLPLDAHPRLGNNAQICEALGLQDRQPFGDYHGMTIGFRGSLPVPMPYTDFKQRVHAILGNTLGTMDFGRDEVRTVAVVSGGAADGVAEAGETGVDVYLSGEPKLEAYSIAQEHRVNVIFAGHYATEVFGVRAVAGWLATRFDVQAGFIDMGIRF